MTQNVKKILKLATLILFFTIIIGYAFFRSSDLIFGVKIKNVNLIDGATVENNILSISGTAKNATKLILNGREISVDQVGNWQETIVLLLGYNMINIKAEDKFGHVDEKNYQLMYKSLAGALRTENI